MGVLEGLGRMPQGSGLAAHLSPFCWAFLGHKKWKAGRSLFLALFLHSCFLPYLPDFDLMSLTERKAKIEQPLAVSFQSLESEHSSHIGAGMGAAGLPCPTARNSPSVFPSLRMFQQLGIPHLSRVTARHLQEGSVHSGCVL